MSSYFVNYVIKGGERLTEEEFLKIANALYNSEEYNKAVCDLAYAKSKSDYYNKLIPLLKAESTIINSVK